MSRKGTRTTTHPLAGHRVRLVVIDELSSMSLNQGDQQTKKVETKTKSIRKRKMKKSLGVGRV